jgi:two-component system sensor histidine kinase KdpD
MLRVGSDTVASWSNLILLVDKGYCARILERSDVARAGSVLPVLRRQAAQVATATGKGRRWMQGTLGGLSGRRRAWGWLLAIAGPAALVGILSITRSAHSSATEVVLFLGLAVAVAIVGGLVPALTVATLSVAALNYWFTPPLYTWKVARAEHIIALAVFALVAVAVSSIVDLAARRSEQAARSRAEAETLSQLAASVLQGEDSVAAVLRQLRAAFDVTHVELLELNGARWGCVAGLGDAQEDQPPSSGSQEIPLSATLKLSLRGGQLSGDDKRLATAFAAHTALVLERGRLRARASEAQRLEEGLAIRTALLAAVSHDLRTPLALIKAAASSLRLPGVEWSPADRAELLATVEDSTDTLQRLVDNLLDLSRLQTGVVRPMLRPMALDEVVLQAVEAVPLSRLDLDVPEDLPLVLTDAGLLERVIANVVENAVHHAAHARQPVTITARAWTDHVVLRVVDHGPGVPDAAKARMFEAFQRVGDAPAGTGTGLGLAVARGFTTAMNATLTAEDTPGGGLTMVLAMPKA